MGIAEFLRQERYKRCLSQEEMAKKIGVSRAVYVTYENAWVNPKTNKVSVPGREVTKRIAKFTKTAPEYVLKLIENERREK